MDAALKLVRQRFVHHAVAFDAGLSPEGLRHDMNTEVGFSSRPRTCMPGMLVRLVDDIEMNGRKGLRQLLGNGIPNRHDVTELRAFSRPAHRLLGAKRERPCRGCDIARSVLSRLAGGRVQSA